MITIVNKVLVINYCGHGYHGGVATSGFDTDAVEALEKLECTLSSWLLLAVWVTSMKVKEVETVLVRFGQKQQTLKASYRRSWRMFLKCITKLGSTYGSSRRDE